MIDYEDADVRALAVDLARDTEQQRVAARCFEWVRDNIRHNLDHNENRVTISASEVLHYGTSLCYSKSHLLAALISCERHSVRFGLSTPRRRCIWRLLLLTWPQCHLAC